MAKNSEYKKWGEWIDVRAHFVGLKTKRALAKALDVSPRQLDRWLKCESMPNLHERSRQMLAKVLKLKDVPDHHQIQWMHAEDPKYTDYIGNGDILDLLSGNQKEYQTEEVIIDWHKDYNEPVIPGLNISSDSDKDIRREITGIMQALSADYLAELNKQAKAIMKKWLDGQPPVSSSSSRLKIAGKAMPKRHSQSMPHRDIQIGKPKDKT